MCFCACAYMKSVHTTNIKQSNNIQNRPKHHTRFPRLPCNYKSTKAIGSLRGYFSVKEQSFPVFLLIVPVPVWCFRVGDFWSCCLVLLPGPAAWSCCLVLLPGPAWSCLIRLGLSWSCLVTWPAVSWWFLFPRFNNVQRQMVAGRGNLVYFSFKCVI
jgi:hypothetical protein